MLSKNDRRILFTLFLVGGGGGGLDLSFAGSQGEYHCMWRCPRPGLNPSGLVNNSGLAAGPQFTEIKIL